MTPVEIIGRSSSHFTRVARIFAEALSVPYRLIPVFDMNQLGAEAYGGHPALKMPALRTVEGLLVGTENICRALAERVPASRVIWPEALASTTLRNAQELIWHAMAAQVQWVTGVANSQLPADSRYFVKVRQGLTGALGWLDSHWVAIEDGLPAGSDLSLLEVTAFCLVEHLRFRPSVAVGPYAALTDFCARFGTRRAAQATPYQLDSRPG